MRQFFLRINTGKYSRHPQQMIIELLLSAQRRHETFQFFSVQSYTFIHIWKISLFPPQYLSQFSDKIAFFKKPTKRSAGETFAITYFNSFLCVLQSYSLTSYTVAIISLINLKSTLLCDFFLYR